MGDDENVDQNIENQRLQLTVFWTLYIERLMTYLCTLYSSLQGFAGPAVEEIGNKFTDWMAKKRAVQFTDRFVKWERKLEKKR